MPGVWGGRGMRRVNRVTEIEVTENQTRSGVRTRVIPRIDRQSLGDSILPAHLSHGFVLETLKLLHVKARTRFYSFFDGRPTVDYQVPKIIEIIKDPSVDNRTNSTPLLLVKLYWSNKWLCIQG